MNVRSRPALVLLAMLGLSFGGCSMLGGGEEIAPAAGLGCVDDSSHCVAQRSGVLRGMMADPQRRWVREPSSPAAYASGVRLWAFKQKKRDLSCDDLAIGQREAEVAPSVLRGPGGTGLTPAQVSRALILAEEVGRELSNERKRRCRA